MTGLARLIYMVNQIARNFAVQGEAAAIAATADHIRKYWDPRMKEMIFAYDGDELSATARAAIAELRQPAA